MEFKIDDSAERAKLATARAEHNAANAKLNAAHEARNRARKVRSESSERTDAAKLALEDAQVRGAAELEAKIAAGDVAKAAAPKDTGQLDAALTAAKDAEAIAHRACASLERAHDEAAMEAQKTARAADVAVTALLKVHADHIAEQVISHEKAVLELRLLLTGLRSVKPEALTPAAHFAIDPNDLRNVPLNNMAHLKGLGTLSPHQAATKIAEAEKQWRDEINALLQATDSAVEGKAA